MNIYFNKRKESTQYTEYDKNMFDQKKLDRINELAKKNKSEGLTNEELVEREALRKEYLEHFRSHFKSRLENIKVVSPEEYEQEMKNKNN